MLYDSISLLIGYPASYLLLVLLPFQISTYYKLSALLFVTFSSCLGFAVKSRQDILKPLFTSLTTVFFMKPQKHFHEIPNQNVL